MKRQRDDPPAPGMVKRQAGVARGPVGGAGGAMGAVHRLTTNDALTYLREVKNRFADKKDVYDTFLEIMKEFKAQRIDTAGVIMRVKDLFRGHKELVLGFNTFLPKGYEIQLADVADMDDEPPNMMQNKQPVEFDQAINYVNKIKTRFAQDERVYKAFLEILNMYRKGQKTITNVYDEVAVLFRQHNDLLEEFTYFLPDNSPPQGGHPGFRNLPGARHNVMAPGGGYGRPGGPMTASRFIASRGGPYGAAMGAMGPGAYGAAGGGGGLNKRKGTRPGAMGEEDYGYGSGRFGGPLDREMQFFEKVKARLRNRELYQDFLKCLNLYAQEIISRQELLTLAQDIIGRYGDLMEGFQRFLQRCETMDAVDNEMRSQFGAGKISAKDMARLKGQTVRDKMLSKPISEVAAEYNPDDRCTPSYVRVPASYPKVKSSGRTAIGDEVLNDAWVSIISGSEDYSFKLMRKNQYEEALFRCEDDRFELDMCIQTNASALKKLRPLRDAVGGLSPEERAAWRLPEGALGAIHFRAVERIYGDQGPQIVELLRKNPTVAIPVIVLRLEQKEAEWLKVREEMNKLWRKVFEQNYHKSLDHRSFYFKQSDKKGLMPKAMLQEVRDAADRRRLDERQLQGLAGGGSPSSFMLQPDLAYDYNSSVVFDDVYQAVVYGIEEQLTGDVRDAVIRFWHSMVEPFFGRGERAYAPLHTKTELQQLEAEEHADKASSSSEQDEQGEGGGKAGGRKEDGAESGGAAAGGADATPEPGTTPETDGKGDALAALLAAGAGDLSEPEGDGGGRGAGRLRDMSVDPSKQQADDDDETAADRYYNVCKPLNTRANAAAAAHEPAGFDPQKQHVLYGNDNHYFFFRLHRHVYDRLAAAQRCAREKNQPQFRQTGDEHIRKPAPDPQAEAARAEEAARLHGEFMRMLRQVLDGHMDSSTFEDSCRALLGTNSYVLFTLDKLIQKFIKHMASMVQDEVTMRLVDLHKYESARRHPIADDIYRANANVLLHDEPCYRFAFAEGVTSGTEVGNDHAQFAPASSRPPQPDAAGGGGSDGGGSGGGAAGGEVEGGQLQLQLLDPDKSEPQPLGLDSSFQEYIKTLMASPAGANKDKVFLPRNAGGAGRAGAEAAAGPDAPAAAGVGGDGPRLIEALRGVAVANGLECKISCQNSKVSYVLDTEDILYRHHSSRARQQRPKEGEAAAPDLRVPKWQKWLEARSAALMGAQPAAAGSGGGAAAAAPEVPVSAA